MNKLINLTLFSLLILSCAGFSTALYLDHDEGLSDIQSILFHFKQLSSEDQQDICAKYSPEPSEGSITIQRMHTPYKYLGCFRDTSERIFKTLHSLHVTDSKKTCIDWCQAEGFVYAGLEYGTECYCGNQLPRLPNHPKIDESVCQAVCPGNAEEKCGGEWAMSLYETGNESKYYF